MDVIPVPRMKETHKIPAFMYSKQGINGAMEVKGMRHQQGEGQENKPFRVAMLILSGDETPWGDKKAFGVCHVLGRKLGGKGCWLGVLLAEEFHTGRGQSMVNQRHESQTGLEVPCYGTVLGPVPSQKQVQLLSHGLRSCSLPWLYPVVHRDQGDSVHSALIAPGSP